MLRLNYGLVREPDVFVFPLAGNSVLVDEGSFVQVESGAPVNPGICTLAHIRATNNQKEYPF